MIKLLALDMDGTLLNEAKEIPQAHITAIHQAIEKGCHKHTAINQFLSNRADEASYEQEIG